jgi:uncharacterized repeat protein (TIGR01451 family)
MKNKFGLISFYQRQKTASRGSIMLSAMILFLSFFIFLPAQTDAAITVDSVSSANSPTRTATTFSWTHTVGAGNNRLLVVGISVMNAGSNSVNSVTYGGVTLTRIGTRSISSGGSIYLTEMWSLTSPASGSATVVVNVNNAASIAAGAVSFAGVNLSQPLGSFVSASGTAGTATVDATTSAGDMVLDTLTTPGNITFTVGAGQTERWNASAGGSASVRGKGGTEPAVGQTTTMSWSLNQNRIFALGAVPVRPALNAPIVTKSFSPASVLVNSASSMTITLTNPNTAIINGTGFTDAYPAGLVNNAATPASNTCGGTVTMANGGSSLALSGGNIPASGSCSIVVPVRSATAGSYENSTGNITSANALQGMPATATLTVMAPPAATKEFSPHTILPNEDSEITITLTNPNATAITGAAFTDTYPSANMKNTAATPTSNTCGGTVIMTNGGSSVALTGGVIPGGGGCSIVVPVTGIAPGTYTNSTGSITTTNAGTGTAATDTLIVVTAPTATKTFTPAIIPVSGASNMRITILNTNPIAITGLAFTDTYPSTDMQNTAAAPTTNTCGGTVTMTNGGSSVALAGGTVPASGNCYILVPVTATVAGLYTNSTGEMTTDEAGTIAAATATLRAMAPPTVAKSFGSVTIPINVSTNMTITLTNTNAAAMAGVSLTDTYPSTDMRNTAAAPSSNTCGGTVTMTSGGSSVALSGGTIPASGSCAIVVPVTAVAAGTYTNSTGNVTTTNAGTGTAATATLTALAPPAAAKSFSPGTIMINGASSMTITLTNPNATNITGASFTDNYPSGLTNTAGTPTSSTCGGTVTMTNGGSSLALSGGVIPASGNCSIVVPVTSISPGSKINSTGNITTANAGTGTAASATLTVIFPPDISKTFDPAVILPNGAATMTFELTNNNIALAITGVAFTDTYPANMINRAGTPSSNTCGGTVTMANGGGSFAISNVTIAAGAICTIVVPVTGTAAGTYVNSTGPVTSTNAGTYDGGDTDTLTVLAGASATKSFSPSTIPTSATSEMRIVLTNPNTTNIRQVAFTDTYPANMRNTASASPTNTCGGTLTATNNGTSLALTGGTIPASGSCEITVNVTSGTAGTYLNSTGTITVQGGTIAAASATLTVKSPAQIALTKYVTPSSAKPGEEILYTVWYRNLGALPATYLIIADSIPLNTTYVTGSMKIGAASSTYATATPLTDAADADAGTLSGATVYFTIPTVEANDSAPDGSDEGRVYFKVTIN